MSDLENRCYGTTHAFSWQKTLQAPPHQRPTNHSNTLTADRIHLHLFLFCTGISQPGLLCKERFRLMSFLNGEMITVEENQGPILHALGGLHHAYIVRFCSVILCPPPCACPQSSLYTTFHIVFCHRG